MSKSLKKLAQALITGTATIEETMAESALDGATTAEFAAEHDMTEEDVKTVLAVSQPGWGVVDTSVEQPGTELTVIEPQPQEPEPQEPEVEPSVSEPAPAAAPVLLTPPTVLAKTVKLKLAYVGETPAWIEIAGPKGKAWLKKSALVDWTIRKNEIEVVMDRAHARRRSLIAA